MLEEGKANNWESARGIVCPHCGRETFRMINGMCPSCCHDINLAEAQRAEARALIRELRRQLRTEGRVAPELLNRFYRLGGGEE